MPAGRVACADRRRAAAAGARAPHRIQATAPPRRGSRPLRRARANPARPGGRALPAGDAGPRGRAAARSPRRGRRIASAIRDRAVRRSRSVPDRRVGSRRSLQKLLQALCGRGAAAPWRRRGSSEQLADLVVTVAVDVEQQENGSQARRERGHRALEIDVRRRVARRRCGDLGNRARRPPAPRRARAAARGGAG